MRIPDFRRRAVLIVAFAAILVAGILASVLATQSHDSTETPQPGQSATLSAPPGASSPTSSGGTSADATGTSGGATSGNSNAFSYATVAAIIAEKGFSIAQGPPVSGSKGPLRAFVAICRGSTDGACGTTFFFYNNRFVGELPAKTLGTSNIWPENARIVSEAGQSVSIDLLISRAGDPKCCPSGGTIYVTYYWTGKAVAASGPQAPEAPLPQT